MECSLKKIKVVILDSQTLSLYRKPLEKELQQLNENQRTGNRFIETF